MQKYIQITMPDGSLWEVPAILVAESRAQYYARVDANAGQGDYEELYTAELAHSLNDEQDLLDWAANNMNWSDVSGHAIKVETDPEAVDYQEGWMNGDKAVVEH